MSYKGLSVAVNNTKKLSDDKQAFFDYIWNKIDQMLSRNDNAEDTQELRSKPGNENIHREGSSKGSRKL